jgi:hypothetical protein
MHIHFQMVAAKTKRNIFMATAIDTRKGSHDNYDVFAKSFKSPFAVIPAKAGHEVKL